VDANSMSALTSRRHLKRANMRGRDLPLSETEEHQPVSNHRRYRGSRSLNQTGLDIWRGVERETKVET